MVVNEIASCISLPLDGKTTIVFHDMYKFRGIRLTREEEMLLLAVFTEIVRPKIDGIEKETEA